MLHGGCAWCTLLPSASPRRGLVLSAVLGAGFGNGWSSNCVWPGPAMSTVSLASLVWLCPRCCPSSGRSWLVPVGEGGGHSSAAGVRVEDTLWHPLGVTAAAGRRPRQPGPPCGWAAVAASARTAATSWGQGAADADSPASLAPGTRRPTSAVSVTFLFCALGQVPLSLS